MRQLTEHIVDGDSSNHQLEISVLDEPGAGGAHHQYQVHWGPSVAHPQSGEPGIPLNQVCFVGFQNGPIKEFGVNGVTHEALLAIVIDRLRSFQAGPYACEANAFALSHCLSALRELQKRTRERIQRGVEGTMAK